MLLFINPPKIIVVLFPIHHKYNDKKHFFNGAGVDLCVMTVPQQETSPLLNSNSLQSPANPGKIFKFSILGIEKCLPQKKVLKGSLLILFIYLA